MGGVPLLTAVAVNSCAPPATQSRTPKVVLVTLGGVEHLARFLGLVLWVKSTICARNLGG